MSTSIQTYGLPATTYTVHRGEAAAGVKPFRAVFLAEENRQVCSSANAASSGVLAGIAQTARKPGDLVAVRDIAESLVEISAPCDIGDDLYVVIAAGPDLNRVSPNGGGPRAGKARTKGTAAGQKIALDLSLMNVEKEVS